MATSSNKEDYVVSYLTLRQLIGWIGILMPVAVRLGAWVFEGVTANDSISAYYYTGMRDVFVSTLVMVGVLLACYRSPAWHDNLVASVAGIAAVGIGLFPMDPSFASELVQKFTCLKNDRCYLNTGILGYHFYFVATFFALAFYLVMFRFAAFTPEQPGRRKVRRNLVYRICGLAMLVSFLVIGYLHLFHKGASIFVPETVAVVAFAAAWLVKGQAVLKD